MIRFSISKNLFGLFSFPDLFLKLFTGHGKESEIKFYPRGGERWMYEPK